MVGSESVILRCADDGRGDARAAAPPSPLDDRRLPCRCAALARDLAQQERLADQVGADRVHADAERRGQGLGEPGRHPLGRDRRGIAHRLPLLFDQPLGRLDFAAALESDAGGEMGDEVGVDAPALGEATQPRRLLVRHPLGQVGPAQGERRRRAGLHRHQAGHRQVERLVIDHVVAEAAVECRVGAGRRRPRRRRDAAQPRSLAHRLRQQRAPVLDGTQAWQRHRLGRIGQRLRAAPRQALQTDQLRPPADLAIGVALEQQQPQRRALLPRDRQRLEPGAQDAGGGGRVVDHHQGWLAPAPAGDVLPKGAAAGGSSESVTNLIDGQH
jgi:hypothetical protein